MQFLYDGTHYKTIRITGPRHNYLGLAIGQRQPATITKLAIPEEQIDSIDEREVLSQVTEGLLQANSELGTHYKIENIQYIPGDTPDRNIYKELTKEIIYRLHKKQAFTKTP